MPEIRFLSSPRRPSESRGVRGIHLWSVALGATALVACSDGSAPSTPAPAADAGADAPPSAPVDGEAVYLQPFEDGNTFACATCHALDEPAADGIRRPGHAIGDAIARPSYKGGTLTNFLDAVNTCVTEWMTAPPLTESDPRWTALRGFLADGAPASAPALDLAIVPAPEDLPAGDVEAGRALFNESCIVCHGEDATGTVRGPGLYGTALEPAAIARRIRTSGPLTSTTYDGVTGGRMPFWVPDRLSDAELADVVAFVHDIAEEDAPPTTGPEPEPEPEPSDCDATHPLVGASAPLMLESGRTQHQVAGTVRVVDDCTIVIEDFVFDGGGIDVRIYGGVDGDYTRPTGFAISEDIFGRRFDGEDYTVRIPEDRSLDDLNGVSVWCVAVGANFGHALLAP